MNRLNWKNNKLYLGKEKTGFSVIPYGTTQFFKVVYPDGKESEDFYNLTWAKENSVKAYLDLIQDMSKTA